jgi:hypothetical protein
MSVDLKEYIIGFFLLSGGFFWFCICAGFCYSVGKELFKLGSGDL